jgi:hypothetical protein
MSQTEVKLIKHSTKDLVADALWFKDDESLPEIIERLGPNGEGWDINLGNVTEFTDSGGRRALKSK